MRVTLEDWKVPEKLRKISSDRGLGLYGASQMAKGMDPYVPYEHGDLSGDYVTSPFEVTYTQPYARYQFYGAGFNHNREQHPLATGRWSDAYQSAHAGELARDLTAYLRRMA